MKRIPLTRGLFAEVDDSDFDYLSGFNWCIAEGMSTKQYAARGTKSGKKQTRIWMHRVILDAPKGCSVDHIDGNGLNNQKHNLRLCVHKENIRNGKLRTTNRSGYKGVSFITAKQRFAAHIKVDYKSKYLGYFNNAKDAALAYNEAARNLFGEFANLNQV